MDDESSRHLGYLMCLFELKHGERLIKEGLHSASMYIVYSGCLRISTAAGKSQVRLAELKEGEWVGEIALLDPGPASASVHVHGETTVLEFSHQALQQFIHDRPSGALCLLNALALRLASRLNQTSEGMVQSSDSGLHLVKPTRETKAGLVTTMLRMLHRDKEGQ
jgi:CRP/FNR family cyclic AMP-dependent transcriptional regulator